MMETTRKLGILIGVDGSAESDAAVRWATHEAILRDAPVTLMHVVAPVVANWSVRSLLADYNAWQDPLCQALLRHPPADN
jgi:nucleotide-binding universal stress UspA family protein